MIAGLLIPKDARMCSMIRAVKRAKPASQFSTQPGLRWWSDTLQDAQTSKQLLTELCGFSTIVIGTFLLNATKDWDANAALMPPGRSGAPFNAMRPVHDDPEIQTTSKAAGVGRLSAAFSRMSLFSLSCMPETILCLLLQAMLRAMLLMLQGICTDDSMKVATVYT